MVLPITVIIPFNNEKDKSLQEILDNLFLQTKFPNEIIIILTNKNKSLKKIYKKKIPLKKVKIKVFFKKNAYPGSARNLGILKSKNSYIAFLDEKTIPEKNWLNDGYKKLKQKKIDIVYGQTIYVADKFKEKIIISSTVGSKIHTTLPGSIVDKKIFFKCGIFLENVRSGEDGDWFKRIKLHKILSSKNYCLLKYKFSNIQINKIFGKWFIYYKSSAHLDQLKTHRQIYILTFLIFLMVFIYNWNHIFADWDQDSNIYIHHITKKTILYLGLIYLFFRGIFLPLSKGSKMSFLFPFNFILVFLFSWCLDFIKTYCYLTSYFRKN